MLRCQPGLLLPMVEAQAVKIVVSMGESLGAIATTIPISSPRSPSTITKSPGYVMVEGG